MDESFYVETDEETDLSSEVLPDGSDTDGNQLYDIGFYGTARDLLRLANVVVFREFEGISVQDFAEMGRGGKVVEKDDDKPRG